MRSLHSLNPVTAAVITKFIPEFVPAGTLMLLREGEMVYYMTPDCIWLKSASLKSSDLPNVLLYDEGRQLLFAIDTPCVGGQIDSLRAYTLSHALQKFAMGVVIVNAFECRRDLDKLSDLPWSTTAWFANEPKHLLHFGSTPECLTGLA